MKIDKLRLRASARSDALRQQPHMHRTSLQYYVRWLASRNQICIRL